MNRTEAKSWIESTCGKGWLALVDAVFDALPPGATVEAAYQEWAALKFDVTPHDEKFETFLESVEEASLETCEICGAKGSGCAIDGWEHTRCEDHTEGGTCIG